MRRRVLLLVAACAGPATAPAPQPRAAAEEPRFRWAAGDRSALAATARAELARRGAGRARVVETGGAVVVTMRQEVDDVEVFRGETNVLLRVSDRTPVALSGDLRRTPRTARGTFRRTIPEAVAGLLGVSQVTMESPTVALAPGARARVKQVYFPDGESLLPAYAVELTTGLDTTSSRLDRFVISAEDGRVLHRQSLTASHSYRVWASPDGTPREGPQADFAPHPLGVPHPAQPPYIDPVLLDSPGFDVHGDLWLAATATETSGNNADTYTDRLEPDGFSSGDVRGATTAAGVFGATYDITAPPDGATQAQAAVVQAFYTVNWLHDWWYDSGFDEAAGNAQADNYDRGGVGGDALHIEVQDQLGIEADNANMSTPSDGESPTMQIYAWTAGTERRVFADPPGRYLLAVGTDTAHDVTAALVRAVPTDACDAITASAAGKILLADRSARCTVETQASRASDAGAVVLILADDVDASLPPVTAADAAVPVVSITRSDGEALDLALAAGTVSVSSFVGLGPDRDGALDGTLVSHEWGHYLHHRLADCGTLQCDAISEGWGDFISLHTMLRDGDDVGGVYGLALYALGGPGYFGLRRYPYSADFSVNALTFRHISNGVALPDLPDSSNPFENAEVHNAGEIWASMMWEAYVALHREGGISFEAARRRMSDLVVLGMALSPPDATFTEVRDALLAAALATSQDDFDLLARAFARRGAGSCAVSPPRDSESLTGVRESFDVKARVELGDMTIDDVTRSCDDDGIIDADEAGLITVQVTNTGAVAIADGTVNVTSPTEGIVVNAASVAIPLLAPLSSTTVTVAVSLAPTFPRRGLVDLEVAVTSDAACDRRTLAARQFRVNVDDLPSVSRTDDVESETTTWTLEGDRADQVWRREAAGAAVHFWRGADVGFLTDASLVSPPLEVGPDPFQVSFRHGYSFEAGDGFFFDGGVIEISDDGGATWRDVADLGADPGYRGELTDVSGNPLAGRDALVGTSIDQTVILGFGTRFAGETVQLRFRLATDEAVAADGWRIDTISFTGITNSPFARVVSDATPCGAEPDAGPEPDAAPPDGGSASRPDAGMTDPPDDCGCAVSPHRTRTSWPLALLAALAVSVVRNRRR
jgi:large repetitive protein